MLAALGPESSRDPQLRAAMADGVNALLTVLEELIARRRTDAADVARGSMSRAAAEHASTGHARAEPAATAPAPTGPAPTEHAPIEPAAVEPIQAALAALAAMSGGLSLARTLAGDPERSDAALRGAAALAKRAAA